MKDPLFGNKVAAAALTVVLLAFGVPITLNTLGKVFAGHHGHEKDAENPFHLAYIPAEIQIGTGPKVEAPKVSLGELLANASAQRGERSAALCAACHTFAEGEANGIGPNLWNIVNRPVGGISGYSYSNVVANAGGVWSYDRLDPYLANSQSYLPGTTMAQMVRKDTKRADILAYLATLSDDPVPFPEPAPAEVAEVAEDAAGD